MRQLQNRRPYTWLTPVIILVAVVVLAIGAIGIVFVETRLIATTGESLALAADDIADMLDRILYERYGDILVTSQAPVFQGRDRTAMSDYLAILKKTHPVYNWLGVTDAKGRIIASTNPPSVGKDRGGRVWFQAVRDRGSPYVQDAEVCEDFAGTLVVAFAAPVKNRRGEFLGVVSSHVSVPSVVDILAATVRGLQLQRGSTQKIEYQFLTRDGGVVADSILRQEGNVNLKQMGLLSALFVGSARSGYVEEAHLRRHVPVVTGYAQTRGYGEFPGLHWGVLIRMDRSEILAPIRMVLWRLGVMGGILFVPLLGFLLWTTGRLRKEWAETQRAKETLERLRRQNELILNSAGEGIYGLDLLGNTTFVNPAAARMLGWDIEELIGKPMHAVLHHSKPDGSPYPADECPIYAAFKDGRVRKSDDEVFWRKDGTSFSVAYISTPLRERGAIVGAVVTFQDITEHKREAEIRARLLEEVISAQEEERRRIARELHDETGQSLTALLVGLRTVEGAHAIKEAQAQARELRRIAALTLDEVGRLARGLHPSVLDDLGLVAALERYTLEFAESHGIKVALETRNMDSKRLPLPVETALYRIAQEALTNTAKHALAHSARILVERLDSSVQMVVRDDGCGFEVAETLGTPGNLEHLGLHNMHERAALLNGSITIESMPACGTSISVRIPLGEEAHGEDSDTHRG
jgi:PAS domain S-box-containing protein